MLQDEDFKQTYDQNNYYKVLAAFVWSSSGVGFRPEVDPEDLPTHEVNGAKALLQKLSSASESAWRTTFEASVAESRG